MPQVKHERVIFVNTNVKRDAGQIETVKTPATFAGRLALALTDHEFGVTQAELAKAVGYKNQSSIGNILSDPTRSGSSRTFQMAQALHVEPAWLSDGLGPMRRNDTRAATTSARSAHVIEVPMSCTGGGMSLAGKAVAEYEMLAGNLPIDRDWLRHELPELSNPSNLAIMPGYGDSMLGTYNDGDLLFVDRGVQDVKLDAVYAFRHDGGMYIKRIQRLPTGNLKIISDNKKYESYEITKGKWRDFVMVGRVLGVLNWNRM